jgi:hypothetical protein
MYEMTRVDGIEYNLAFIPAEFDASRPKPFARSYMKALYETGYELGRKGYPWAKSPPGLSVEASR